MTFHGFPFVLHILGLRDDEYDAPKKIPTVIIDAIFELWLLYVYVGHYMCMSLIYCCTRCASSKKGMCPLSTRGDYIRAFLTACCSLVWARAGDDWVPYPGYGTLTDPSMGRRVRPPNGGTDGRPQVNSSCPVCSASKDLRRGYCESSVVFGHAWLQPSIATTDENSSSSFKKLSK